MAYDARTVANEFLRLAKASHRSLSNMQLQKLVYIAHGWALTILGHGLINEAVEAWQYGPVIPTLYYSLSRYGSGTVSALLSIVPSEELSPEDKALIASVWRSYGLMSAFQLSTITHQRDTPWSRTVRKFGQHSVIPERYITEHYQHLNERNRGIRER